MYQIESGSGVLGKAPPSAKGHEVVTAKKTNRRLFQVELGAASQSQQNTTSALRAADPSERVDGIPAPPLSHVPFENKLPRWRTRQREAW